MSTSVSELSYSQRLFKRPAHVFAVVFILFMIGFKPNYNTLPVLLSIPLYMILYQCRYYIYRLGMGRFDFLAILIYAPFAVSFFVPWDYKNNIVMPEFGQFTVGNIEHYIGSVFSVAWQSVMDIKTHWETIMFAPAFASILYFFYIEFDRKSVKKTDAHTLELTDTDLYRRGSIFDAIATALFVVVSFLYGPQVGGLAIIIYMVLLFSNKKIYLLFSTLLSICIIVFGYSHFNYLSFLCFPRVVAETLIADRFLAGIKVITSYAHSHDVGQFFILLPYLFTTSIIAFIGIKHKVKVQAIAEEKAKQEEIRTTSDAIEFGVELSSGKPVRLTHDELNTHMYINGASGSGKTVAMLNFVIEAAGKGLPLIYIDGKGATDLVTKMAKIAARYNRVFKIFTLSPRDVESVNSYDFLGSGTFTEKKNRIMQLFIVAEQAGAAFYQDNLETFINRVFMLAEHQKLNIDLFRFLGLISNINDLVDMAKEDIILADGSKINLQSYFEEIRDMKQENSPRTRIITKLDPFIHSSYGYLFNVIGKDNVIRLKESIKNGEIVLFLFNASSFTLDTERVAKMVISDINATFSEFGAEKTWIKTFCCFDEFKSYETDAIAKTIALHRSNGMHAIIGTQSLSLIDRNIGNAILTNCQTHLIMNSASDDAQRFADEFGTANKIESTTRIKADVQEVQDITTKRVRDVIIDKQDIKDILVKTGHGYLHRKALGMKPVKIQVTQKI